MIGFQLPIFKGTDLFPDVMKPMTVVRVDVALPAVLSDSERYEAGRVALRMVDAARSEISSKYLAMNYQTNLSGQDFVKRQVPIQGGMMHYSSNFGQEIVRLTMFPTLGAVQRQGDVHTITETRKSVYISAHVGSTGGISSFEVYLNDQSLGIVNTQVMVDAWRNSSPFDSNRYILVGTHVFRFDADALAIPAYNDAETSRAFREPYDIQKTVSNSQTDGYLPGYFATEPLLPVFWYQPTVHIIPLGWYWSGEFIDGYGQRQRPVYGESYEVLGVTSHNKNMLNLNGVNTVRLETRDAGTEGAWQREMVWTDIAVEIVDTKITKKFINNVEQEIIATYDPVVLVGELKSLRLLNSDEIAYRGADRFEGRFIFDLRDNTFSKESTTMTLPYEFPAYYLHSHRKSKSLWAFKGAYSGDAYDIEIPDAGLTLWDPKRSNWKKNGLVWNTGVG